MNQQQPRKYTVPSCEVENVTNVYNKIASKFSDSRPQFTVNGWGWPGNFLIKNTKNGDNILDIGCGGGRIGEVCTEIKRKYIGYDSSEVFVQICKDKGLKAVVGDMCELPFEDEFFDNITMIASFHHLATVERRRQALNEMHRVLKKGGKILCSVWSKNQPEKTRRVFTHYGDTIVPWNKIHQRYYYIFMIEEIKNLFTDAKFTILSHSWECGNEVFVIEK